jgi:chromosomal replication initiator protein
MRISCGNPVGIVWKDCAFMVEKNTWDSIKNQLCLKLSAEAYHNWVSRTRFVAHDGRRLRVAVPDEMTKLWMESELAPRVESVIRDLLLPVAEIQYELSTSPLGTFSTAAAPMEHAASSGNGHFDPGQFQLGSLSQLNPRLTFNSFVVGSCNQFAHAAATAVATSPSRSYNPLLIYGGTGMGKTHLIHAVGHSLAGSFSGMRIVYTSGERFMNEMVNCIRTDRMPLFHQHYRTADVLLIDDIHFLGGKERTQEEFFHTFNELYDHQKQIVLSSDSLPKQIPNLVDRLRSRFEWGLMVDVQPPDLETKMAILDRKAEDEGVRLPEDVRIYIATKTKSNVRELQGALVKLVASSSVTNSPITLAMAQQVLRPILPDQQRRVTIEAVTRAVAERYSLQPSQLKQKTNAHEISRPRQVAMYLARELTSASLPEIGRAFGGKHHTTVLHSIRKVETMRRDNPDLNKLIHSISDLFH